MRIFPVTAPVVIAAWLFLQGSAAVAASGNLDGEIGAEGARAVAAQMGFYDEPRLTDYVTTVGNRLVAALNDDRFTFRFFVADDPSPNAFALPGGYVFVTRGLLPLLQTEDELAGVMAHEIIHVTERHGVRRSKRGLLGGLLQAPGQIVGGLVGESVGALINAPITGANQLVLANYSRGQERDADTGGFELAGRAGYDPTHLSRFLLRLADTVETVTGEAEKRSMLRDHPITADRIEYLGRLAEDITAPTGDTSDVDLFALLEGLPVGPNPDRGDFVENEFLHPGLDLGLVFPAGWQKFNYPIAVGAVTPAQDAALIYSIEDSPGTPTELGEAFVAGLPADYRPLLDRAEPVTVNGVPGYLVTLKQSPRHGEKIYVHMAWAAFDTFTLRLAAYGTDSQEQTLRTSARSFRRLTPADRAAMRRSQIGIAAAQAGETVEAFSTRVGNRWSRELTLVINDIDGDTLEQRRLKILEVVPYFDVTD
ncbi:MAG: M48 family metalloprotease [Gammaproteobacteria bacterium]